MASRNLMNALAIQNKFKTYKQTNLNSVSKQVATAAKELMKLLRKGQNQQQRP
jgi:hypothetical protein